LYSKLHFFTNFLWGFKNGNLFDELMFQPISHDVLSVSFRPCLTYIQILNQIGVGRAGTTSPVDVEWPIYLLLPGQCRNPTFCTYIVLNCSLARYLIRRSCISFIFQRASFEYSLEKIYFCSKYRNNCKNANFHIFILKIRQMMPESIFNSLSFDRPCFFSIEIWYFWM